MCKLGLIDISWVSCFTAADTYIFNCHGMQYILAFGRFRLSECQICVLDSVKCRGSSTNDKALSATKTP